MLTEKTTDHHSEVSYYLQSAVWAQFRQKHGWDHTYVDVDNKHKIVFYKRHVLGLGYIYYAPRCLTPFGDVAWDSKKLASFKQQVIDSLKGAFLIILEPVDTEYSDDRKVALHKAGFKCVDKNMQHQSTIKIDLTPSEEDINLSFTKTARYDIRAAQKSGITIKESIINTQSLDLLYGLMHGTSQKSSFFIRSKEFSMGYWEAFSANKEGRLFFAYKDDELIAGAYVISIGSKAWYKDGGSLPNNQYLGATSLLQWGIMKHLKTDGVASYDLCGVASGREIGPNDQLYNVYNFKKKFSKEKKIYIYSSAYHIQIGSFKNKIWNKFGKVYVKIYTKWSKDYWY